MKQFSIEPKNRKMKILIILLFIVYSSNSENEPFHECDPFPAPLPTG
jgi:hypothetical protein